MTRRCLAPLLAVLALIARPAPAAAGFVAGSFPTHLSGQAFVDASTCTTSSSSAAGTTLNLASTTGLGIGTLVSGHANIPTGDRIASINAGANTVTLTAALTGTVPGSTALSCGSSYAASNLAAGGQVLIRSPIGQMPAVANDPAFNSYPFTIAGRQGSSTAVIPNPTGAAFTGRWFTPHAYGHHAKKEDNFGTGGSIVFSSGGVAWTGASRYMSYKTAIVAWVVDVARGVGYRPYNDTSLCTQVGATLKAAGYISGTCSQLGWLDLAGQAGFNVTPWASLLYEASITATGACSAGVVHVTGLTGSEVAGDILHDNTFHELGVLTAASSGGGTVTMSACPSATITNGENLTIADAAFSRNGTTANPAAGADLGDIELYNYASTNAASLFTIVSDTTPSTKVVVDKLVLAQWRPWDVPGLAAMLLDFEPNDCDVKNVTCEGTPLRPQLIGAIGAGKSLPVYLLIDNLNGGGGYTGLGQSNLHDIYANYGVMLDITPDPNAVDAAADLQAQLVLFTGPAGTQAPDTAHLTIMVRIGPQDQPFPEANAIVVNSFLLAPTLPGFTGLAAMRGYIFQPNGAPGGGAYSSLPNRTIEGLLGLPLLWRSWTRDCIGRAANDNRRAYACAA